MMASITTAAVSTAAVSSQLLPPKPLCRSSLITSNGRTSMRSVSSRFEVLRPFPSLRFSSNLDSAPRCRVSAATSLNSFVETHNLQTLASSQSNCLALRAFLSYDGLTHLSKQGLLWRSTKGFGMVGRSGVCRSAKAESKTAETAESRIDSVAGGGNNGNGNGNGGGGGGGGGGGEALGWISSGLVFAFYSALVYYAAALAPGQTPYRDQYFIEKLVGLRSGDGFILNTILVCEFYIMGLWPMIYASLLLPSGCSEKSSVRTWPFLVLSFAVGAFSLLPYFGLWRPPPPKVTRDELNKFPLNVLENKLVSYGILLSGIGLIVAAALADEDNWTEFYQYIRESKFIHVMSIDFLTLSSLAPFWVYNDMATRRWLDKGSWLLPLSLIPYIGPALYLVLRPPLPLSMVEDDT